MDSVQGPLLYSILGGILLVLSVMMAITCLLVHHNKHLNRLQHEVKQSRTRRGTQRHAPGKGQSKVEDDGYIVPRQVPNATHAPLPPKFFPPSHTPTYMEPTNRQYENISLASESDNSYDSVGKFRG